MYRYKTLNVQFTFLIFTLRILIHNRWDVSVGILSRLWARLDNQGIWVLFSTGVRIVSPLHSAQTGPGNHPVYLVGTGRKANNISAEAKSSRIETCNTPLHQYSTPFCHLGLVQQTHMTLNYGSHPTHKDIRLTNGTEFPLGLLRS